ncbi:MAG: ABC transporter ATP-binding protein/permease [Defluviitaleaceae bacterium]|nr:ABC transporter ATP-binding protein/permease [Defluviitaleaceae bacterium]
MFKGLIFLLSYSWKFSKRYVLALFLLQFVSATLPLMGIILPRFIIDELLGEMRIEVLFLLVGVLITVNLVGGIIVNFLRGYTFSSKGVVFSRFQTLLADKLSKCDFEYLENPEFLDTKERAKKFLYANGQGFGAVLDSAISIIGKIFIFFGIVTILMTLSILIVILFVALVLISAFVESRVRKDYVKWDMEKAPIERKTAYFINLVEDFSYGKEMRIYNLKEWIVSKISAHLKKSDEFYKSQVKSHNKSNYFNTLTSFVRDGTTYFYLSFAVIRGAISIGDFTMYISAVFQFSSAMNNVMQSMMDIRQFGFYYDALDKYMNVPSTIQNDNGKPVNRDSRGHTLEFRNVSFRYNENEEYILNNINLKIEPFEKLSIVGENGAGKTTFVKLLCRLYDPTEGNIFLDGVDIKEYSFSEYISLISAVFQDYKLFSFSIKENIVFDKCEISDSEVETILRKNGFEEKLNSLKEGVHNNIYKNFEPDGFEPSGGEGQKIAIAKALFKDSPIVILDEPTSALDPRAEHEIYMRFNEMTVNKTAIFISHRLASSRFCNKIAFFLNGEIVEYGSHDELINLNGNYAELFELQSQYYT